MIPDLNRVRGYSVVKLTLETTPGAGRFGTGGKFVFRFTARDREGLLQCVKLKEFERSGFTDLNEALAEFLVDIPDLNEQARGVAAEVARERGARQGGMREVPK